jgi:hypothetical protein
MKHVRLIRLLLIAVVVIFAAIPAAKASMTVNLELSNTPIKGAIDSLFMGTGLNYTVDPSITGNVVELKLKGISFKDALDAFCDAAGLAYTAVDGVYTITSAPSKSGAGPTTTVITSGSSRTRPASAPAAAAPRKEPATEEPPQQQKAQTANQAGPQSGQVTVTQTANPVYYNPPSYPAYSGYQGNGLNSPPYYQAHNIGFVGGGGGWGGPVMVGPGPTLFWTRDYLPPPPPGYVNGELQRFLQTQYAIKGRQYVVPIY